MQAKNKLIIIILALSNYCFGQIPILNSAPSITNKVIYLDFDGQKVIGTAWNSGNLVNAAASGMNATNITTIWKRISEDYRPFDVNITTDSMRFNNALPSRRIRVIITPTSSWYGSAGGVAYVGSFSWGGTPGTPCWVFENQLGFNVKSIAEAAAHEVGHTLTLRHQSRYNSSCVKTDEYHPGQGTGMTSWAPIMGVGYSRNVTIWHTGTSANGCNVIQFDHSNGLTGITGPNYLSFLPDDVGDTYPGAKILNLSGVNLVDSGIITRPTDLDAYQFTICNNRYVSINVKPWALDTTGYNGANLDVRLYLYNSTNSVLAVDTPLAKLNALVGMNLTAGSYYFTIDGGRSANYTDYGSLGKYYISITATNPPALANTILTNSNICSGQNTTLTYSSNGTPTNWQWTITGPTTSTSNIQNPVVNFSAGIHTIELLATSVTSLSCPTTVTLNIGSVPNVSAAASNTSFCAGIATSLTASGTASLYFWFPGNLSGPGQSQTPLVNTTYTVVGYNGTCSNSAITSVNVIPNFTLSAAASDNLICTGQTITLTATGATNYTFSPGGSTTNPSTFTPAGNTTYTITGEVASCAKKIGVVINISPAFSVNVQTSDSLICLGQSVTVISTGATNYTLDPGGLTGFMTSVSPTVTTTYTVTGINNNQCYDTTSFYVKVFLCDVGLSKFSADAAIRVYPNPANDFIYVETPEHYTRLEIFGVLGNLIYAQDLKDRRTARIASENWAKGIYTLKISSGDSENSLHKIIIE